VGTVSAQASAVVSWRAALAKRLRSRTLADAYASGLDNFLLLRFVAASLVIYSHSYALSGGTQTEDIFQQLGWRTYAGKIAVELFFCVSGFLVTASLVRWHSTRAFLKARALRLLPAYAVCLAMCAFVLGPLITKLPLGEYLLDPQTPSYVYSNLGFRHLQWSLPGVYFNSGQYHDVVNGSIWSLPVEATMYLWLAALGLVGVYRRTWLATSVVLILVVVGSKYWTQMPVLTANPRHLPYPAMFALGSLAYLHRRFIPISHAGMLACIALAWATHDSGLLADFSMALALAYFCFWFAYSLPWHGFNRFGDYSYGIYLWGFPSQQLIALWFGPGEPGRMTLLALPLALLCAIASWHLVERPTLRLKKRPILKQLGLVARLWRWNTPTSAN
jgi:peptidoglycan/LPS O-acetylase OafA/YrhL